MHGEDQNKILTSNYSLHSISPFGDLVCCSNKWLTNNSARDGPRGDVNPLLHERSQCKPETVDDAEVVGDRGAWYWLFYLPFIRRKSEWDNHLITQSIKLSPAKTSG